MFGRILQVPDVSEILLVIFDRREIKGLVVVFVKLRPRLEQLFMNAVELVGTTIDVLQPEPLNGSGL